MYTFLNDKDFKNYGITNAFVLAELITNINNHMEQFYPIGKTGAMQQLSKVQSLQFTYSLSFCY